MEAQQKQEELALALATTQQAMELYQDTAKRDVRVEISTGVGWNRNPGIIVLVGVAVAGVMHYS